MVTGGFFGSSGRMEIHDEFMAFLGEMITQDISHITTRIMLLSYLEIKKKNSTSHSSLVKEFCISKFFLSNWKPLGGWLL